MGYLFELILELLFGIAKDRSEEMPQIEYRESFTVKQSPKRTAARILASAIMGGVFAVLWILIKDEVRFLFAAFALMGVALLLLELPSAAFLCRVDAEGLRSSYWGLSLRTVRWCDVAYLKLIAKADAGVTAIAVYDRRGKCVADFGADMQNAWYVVKMAEHKNIEIKKD